MRSRASLVCSGPFRGVLSAKSTLEAPGSTPSSTKVVKIAQSRVTVVATTTAATADAAKTVRMPTCAAFQAITMPGKTARTTDGHAIKKDLRAATATATATQGAGLGHLLGEARGIVIGISIEIEIEIKVEVETGSEIAIGIVPGGLTGAEAKCQATKASKAMTKTR